MAEIAEIRGAEAQGRSLLRGLMEDERSTAAAIDALQADARQLRMMPASTVLERLPGMVAELARAGGKSVEWSSSGAEIEVDRRVLEALRDPLLHLVRNAVDHGIEPPADRKRARKPAEGQVVLAAVRERASVAISITDDGRGIDRDKVLEKAKRENLIDAHLDKLTDDQLLRVLARPGFTTAAAVTSVSGRGVGIDVARTRRRSNSASRR
jgi:two-component system chemotaxis sensor kinase CheA